MSSKRFFLSVVIGAFLLLGFLAVPTVIIDPYFHYHAPMGAYQLENQRYQNDGIVKHFEYDAIITGTSMTENFQASEFDKIFGVDSVKVAFPGGLFKEIDSVVKTGALYNDELDVVLRGLDLYYLDYDKNKEKYASYPTYLYDENIFNDVSYILNKEILLKDTADNIEMYIKHEVSTTFDDYGCWQENFEFGREAILSEYERKAASDDVREFTDEDEKRVRENINQNVVQTALDNPDITFYIFFTPYSCMWWDETIRAGKLEYHIATQECAIEEMLKCENIKLYSFCDNFDITCNLDNYKDIAHYGESINSWMLEQMWAGNGLLTKDNYLDYLDEIESYYSSLDYDSYFCE